MKAAFYQFTPSFGKKEENIAKVISAVKDADLDLLVLPELFATGYQFTSTDEVAELSEPIPDGSTTKTLSDLSKEKGIYNLAGWENEFSGLDDQFIRFTIGEEWEMDRVVKVLSDYVKKNQKPI